ncbi:ABC transporter substrate-binding protein [Aidingimonas halophila]|uniref:Putative thiamine transport system substrate-binding protein n=1 Tax=Aidingimonas halophila TaxID=574349 RepID=A0A1H2SA05_9GAMM|nr:ABC transporter substrate-binding protein [Aidingimonas halophila]GHC17964.1 ABC transporter substrate-binding protein [Aidingimonas halophila]SDW28503.1 putative thiamine transport system substrate-binding protein [Aidingimonas halophila]
MRISAWILLASSLITTQAIAAPDPADWHAVEEQAAGQTVYWHAWGGDANTNAYIEWVADRLANQHDIELVHVKVDDASSVVSRVLAEKSAGNDDEGAVDLIWINGENFASMKASDLLFGPFAERLPHFPLTRPDEHPEMRTDFTVPTEGLEVPWGRAQLTFYYDSERVETPPRDIDELLEWVQENPGRFSYPQVPNFLGTTFLKQALISLAEDKEALYGPVEDADFETVTAPLWNYLDALHPYLWREGRRFPESGSAMQRLMGDGELTLTFTFNPSSPAAAVADNQLPPSTRSYQLEGGTLGNVHFVAIPFNASHKAGAMVTANFLLSPEAQAHKQDIDVWGDPTVLDVSKLDSEAREAFADSQEVPAALSPEDTAETLAEPHPSWTERLEEEWLTRYGNR